MSGGYPSFTDQQLETLKRPPSSVDAERSVLGGLILDNDSWEKVEDQLTVGDFYQGEHRVIYKEIEKLVQENTPFDVITLSDALANSKKIDQAGGLAYIGELVANTPTAANIGAYARIVTEKSRMRTLLNTAVDIANLVYDQDGRKSDEVIDEAERKIFQIAEKSQNIQDGPEAVTDVLSSVIDRLDLLMDTKDGITGVSTGFTDLDKMTSGLHPSNLVIVAGRPSMGKTAFAMNLSENVARGAEKPVLVFSLEMPSEDLVVRMISSLGRIDQTRMRNGQLDDEHWTKITASMQIITQEMNLYIDDSAALSPAEIRSRARRLAKEHGGLSMIVVDYLQLMSIPGYESNRTQEVSEISRSLKALAKELEVPVVALSQLNRGVDDRADKRPMMSDLRESGAIEQDADVIMFVYRDEVYHKDKQENKGIGEIIIGKQRNGPIGNVAVTFTGRYCRFADYAPEFQSAQGMM
jgi:replicative DNA helicase